MAKAPLETIVKIKLDYSEFEKLFSEYLETLSEYKVQRFLSHRQYAQVVLDAFLVWLKGKK